MMIIKCNMAAAALVVFIVILRALLLNKLPKRCFKALWAVVILRLLIPFSFEVAIPVTWEIGTNEQVGLISRLTWECSKWLQVTDADVHTEDKPDADNVTMEGSMTDTTISGEKLSNTILTEELQSDKTSTGETSANKISTDENLSYGVTDAAQKSSVTDYGIQNSSATDIIYEGITETDIPTEENGGWKYTDALSDVIQSHIGIWAVIYYLVAALIFAGFVFSYIRIRLPLNESLPCEDDDVREILSHMTRRRIDVRVSDRIIAPVTYGVFYPVIVLPRNCGNVDRTVLFHELAHIRGFDILYKWALTVAVCLIWLNPFAWVMLVLANRDLEYACDETVLCRFPDERVRYAQILIDFEEYRNSLLMNAFSANAVAERIGAIMEYKKATVVKSVAAVLIVAGTLTAFISAKTVSAQTDKAGNTGAQDVVILAQINKEAQENVTSAVTSAQTDKEAQENVTLAQTDKEVQDSVIPAQTDVEPQENLTPTQSDVAQNMSSVPASDGGTISFIWPADCKEITAYYGACETATGVFVHIGVDIKGDDGEPIYAAADGIVKKVLAPGTALENLISDFDYGFYVIISHADGYETKYACCSALYVSEGQEVKQGDVIAAIGATGNATGPHLHFMLTHNGEAVNPLDYIGE